MPEVAPRVPYKTDDVSAIDRAAEIWGDAQLIKTLSCDRLGWTGKPTGSLALVDLNVTPPPDIQVDDEHCSRVEKVVSAVSFSALGGLFFLQSIDSLGDIPKSIALNPLVIGLAGSVAVMHFLKGKNDN